MNNLIIDSLNYYYNIDSIDYEIIEYSKEIYTLLPVLICKKNNEYIKKLYNVIGLYNIESGIFYWAWYLNIEHKDKILSIKLLQDKGLNMDNAEFNLENFFLRKILTTPFFKIIDTNHLKIIFAIGCYLTNVDYYEIHHQSNHIRIIGIYNTDIIETSNN